MSIYFLLILNYYYIIGGAIMAKKEQTENSLIVKSNELIEASYRLTTSEQKIILKLVSLIRADSKDFQRYKIKIKDFIKLLGIKDQSKYTEIPKIAEGLMKKVLTIKENDGILKVAWLSAFKQIDGEGAIEIEFSPYLRPYLLQLKSRFTSYNLQNAIQLKSGYSLRIYELLKQYYSIGERTFTIEKLRYILAIEDQEYPLYADFKRYIIKQAQKEINIKTDISFEFEEIKIGRKVNSIKFIIKNNVKDLLLIDDKTEAVLTKIEIVKGMMEEDITDIEAASILASAKDDVKIVAEKYEIAKGANDITNIVSWMKKAIEKDYSVAKGKKKASTFNNYEQRSYDFVQLEKDLLGLNDVKEAE